MQNTTFSGNPNFKKNPLYSTIPIRGGQNRVVFQMRPEKPRLLVKTRACQEKNPSLLIRVAMI